MRKVVGLVAFLSCLLQLSGQSLQGTIYSAESEAPVPYANVFLAGTLIGTTSNPDGTYDLALTTKGKFQLVVTCVGYEDFITEVEFARKALSLDISLSTDVRQLDEVYVNPDTTNRRQNLAAFQNLFFGSTKNALQTSIENLSDVFVFYDNVEKALFAHSREELVINNDALGYQVIYRLKEFEMDYASGQYRSFGIPRFREQTLSNRKQKRANKERARAYRGSFQHFINALLQDTHVEEGFIVEEAFKVPNRNRPPQALIDQKLREFRSGLVAGNGFVMSSNSVETEEVELTKENIDQMRRKGLIPKAMDSLITAKVNAGGSHKMKVMRSAPSGNSNTAQRDSLRNWIAKSRLPVTIDSAGRIFQSNELLLDENNTFTYQGYLTIVYTKEAEETNYAAYVRKPKPERAQTSQVLILEPFQVYENGYFDVTQVIFNEYMGWSQRMAEMLPLGYRPDP